MFQLEQMETVDDEGKNRKRNKKQINKQLHWYAYHASLNWERERERERERKSGKRKDVTIREEN